MRSNAHKRRIREWKIARLLSGALVVVGLTAAPALAGDPLRLDRLDLRSFDLAASMAGAPRPSVLAVDPAPGADRPARLEWKRIGRTRHFYNDHLIPRVSRRMHKVVPVHLAREMNQELRDYALLDDLQERVRRNALSGAKSAFREFLLDVTSLEGVIASMKGERGGSAAPRTERRRTKLDVAVSGSRPVGIVKHPVGRGRVKLRVEDHGPARLEYGRNWGRRASMYAGYDFDGTYSVSSRIRF